MKKIIKTLNAPQAIGPYSQAVVSNGFVFVSGQIHLSRNGKLVGKNIEEQTHQVMNNLDAILKSAGASFKDVVKSTVYVVDLSIFDKLNFVYESYMTQPFPARETVAVRSLPRGAQLEISMVAEIK